LSVFGLNSLDRELRSHALKDTFGFPAFGPHFEPSRVDRQGIHSSIMIHDITSPRTW
jgi:hypothetical protein